MTRIIHYLAGLACEPRPTTQCARDARSDAARKRDRLNNTCRALASIFALCHLFTTQAEEPAPDFSKVPGVVIDYSPANSRQYIGSPSIAILPDGSYVASHDLFGPNSGNNRTRVFASTDKGKTWNRRAEMTGQWWSTLFVHRDALYLIGTTKEYGHTVIRRSQDGGKTWTDPADKESGLLLGEGRYHCASQPVMIHAGRIWRGMEDAMGPGGWGSHFRAFMMSAPVDADLLKAESWTRTNALPRDPAWLGGKFGGWLEGNAVATPDGRVVDILRVDHKPEGETAAIVTISEDGKTAAFDPSTGFVHFPGGSKKFTIRFDDKSKQYWSLSNWIPPKYVGPQPGMTRNTLALVSSPDLRKWSVKCVVLHHPEVGHHGFQYVDWQFEGEDLVVASRTAFDDGAGGAHNMHDANFLTFHRIEKFRELTMKDSVPMP